MTVALLAGALTGLGLWLALTGLRPAPPPLDRVLSALTTLARPDAGDDGAGRVGRVALRLAAALGARTPERDRQLALAGSTPAGWARDKLVGAVVGLSVPLTVWVGLVAAGIAAPPATGIVVLAAAAVGWVWPDVRLREQVERRRQTFRHALSGYLDLVNVILAGGSGIETALVAAADAADGWPMRRLRHALHNSRRINRPLWAGFDDLADELGIGELHDLGATIRLAGAQGARIRSSLADKADTMRAHLAADTEAAAEATTERMNLPTAVLLAGFLTFVVFPAVTAITATHTGQPCPPDVAGCPPPAITHVAEQGVEP